MEAAGDGGCKRRAVLSGLSGLAQLQATSTQPISDTGSGHICSTIRHHKKNHSRAGSFIYPTFAPIAISPPPPVHCN
jgi:hypothetical protein